MKNQVYLNNEEGLANYIIDITNEFIVSTKEKIQFERQIIHRGNYLCSLVSLGSTPVKSTFSVIYQPKETVVRLIIEAFKVEATTDYVDKHQGNICHFSFQCSQTEYLIPINKFFPNKLIDFIQVEQIADQLIKDHIENFIQDIFNSRISTLDDWSFTVNTSLSNLKLNFQKIIK